jgi:hypothetical protein
MVRRDHVLEDAASELYDQKNENFLNKIVSL